MKTNIGFLDRAVRVVVGAGILTLLVIGPVPGWGLAGLVGLLPILGGLVGYCPPYALLGIDTSGRSSSEAERT